MKKRIACNRLYLDGGVEKVRELLEQSLALEYLILMYRVRLLVDSSLIDFVNLLPCFEKKAEDQLFELVSLLEIFNLANLLEGTFQLSRQVLHLLLR